MVVVADDDVVDGDEGSVVRRPAAAFMVMAGMAGNLLKQPSDLSSIYYFVESSARSSCRQGNWCTDAANLESSRFYFSVFWIALQGKALDGHASIFPPSKHVPPNRCR